jgi:hypothetical protein
VLPAKAYKYIELGGPALDQRLLVQSDGKIHSASL